jgi:hypothetical protein
MTGRSTASSDQPVATLPSHDQPYRMSIHLTPSKDDHEQHTTGLDNGSHARRVDVYQYRVPVNRSLEKRLRAAVPSQPARFGQKVDRKSTLEITRETCFDTIVRLFQSHLQ